MGDPPPPEGPSYLGPGNTAQHRKRQQQDFAHQDFIKRPFHLIGHNEGHGPHIKGALGTHVKVKMVQYLKFGITGLNVKRTNINVFNEICSTFACLRSLLHVCTRAKVEFYVGA